MVLVNNKPTPKVDTMSARINLASWARHAECDHEYDTPRETAHGTLVYRCDKCNGSKVEQGPNYRAIAVKALA